MARATVRVNWSKMADIVAPEQKAAFNAFRSKSETLAAKVDSLPEKQRTPDWDHYKKVLGANKQPLIDEIKKTMEAVKVSRPANTMAGEIEQLKQEYMKTFNDFKTEGDTRSSSLRKQAEQYTKLKCLTLMTNDEVHAAFPEVSREAYEEEKALKGAHDHHDEGDEDGEFDIQIPKLNELFPKKKK